MRRWPIYWMFAVIIAAGLGFFGYSAFILVEQSADRAALIVNEPHDERAIELADGRTVLCIEVAVGEAWTCDWEGAWR